MRFRNLVIHVLPLFFFCEQSILYIPEYIQPPLNLTITATAGGHLLTFSSDNREGGFSGYGVIVGATKALAEVEPAVTLDSALPFCNLPGGQTNYNTTVAIQTGNGALHTTAICQITGLTLTSGQFVGVRARVERDTSPWSTAAVATVP